MFIERSKVKVKAKAMDLMGQRTRYPKCPCAAGRTGNAHVYVSSNVKRDVVEILNALTHLDITLANATSSLLQTLAASTLAVSMTALTPFH